MYELERIRALLRISKIGLVAQKTGLSRAALYKIMNGQDPRLATMRLLTEYFETMGEMNK